jgi:integrase
MGRKQIWPPPIYVRRGRAIMRVLLGPRRYKDYTLGVAGSAEAKAEYTRIFAELEQNKAMLSAVGASPPKPSQGELPLPRPGKPLYVARIVLAYLERVKPVISAKHYCRVLRALRPVAELYGRRLATDFDSLAFEQIQASFVASGLCRRYCNQLAMIVKQCFRWGASKKLLPISVFEGLRTVEALRRGRTSAPESQPVRPANLADVEATLPYMGQITADLVRLIRFTGMRAGEACIIRPMDVNRDGRDPDGTQHPDVWIYVPASHKNVHRGLERVVFLGPQAQGILAPYLLRAPEAYCFSPREAVQALADENGRACNLSGERAPGEHYTTLSLGQAIRRAIAAGNKALAKDGKGQAPTIGRWSAHRLRHLAGTLSRHTFGPEHARAALGHNALSSTAIYAELSREKAAEVMRRIG